jgi:hypothetical protein
MGRREAIADHSLAVSPSFGKAALAQIQEVEDGLMLRQRDDLPDTG